MRWSRPILAAAGLLAATGALAQDDIDCGYPLNADERNYCAQKALSEAEAALSAAYETTLATMGKLDAELPDHLKGSPEALKAAQDAWTDYRQKDCAAYAFPFRGGTRGDALYLSCMIITTMQRTEDLNAMVEDYGN